MRRNVLGVAGFLAGASVPAYFGFKEFKKDQRKKQWAAEMKVVRAELLEKPSMEALLKQMRDTKSLKDLRSFFKHVYLNQHKEIMQTPEDYAWLLAEVTALIEERYRFQTDSKVVSFKIVDKIDEMKLVTSNDAAHLEAHKTQQKVFSIIAEIFSSKLLAQNSTEPQFNRLNVLMSLLTALSFTDTPERAELYKHLSSFPDIKALEFYDVQAAVVKAMSNFALKDSLEFTDAGTIIAFLNEKTISAAAKEAFLSREGVRQALITNCVPTLQNHRDLVLIANNCDDAGKAQLLDALISEKSMSAVMKSFSKDKMGNELATLLSAFKNKYDSKGDLQLRLIKLLNDQTIMQILYKDRQTLCQSKVLQGDALMYLHRTASLRTGFTLYSLSQQTRADSSCENVVRKNI